MAHQKKNKDILKKKIEKFLKRLKESIVFPRMPIAGFVTDEKGIITHVNKEHMKLMGETRKEQAIGLNIFKLPFVKKYGYDKMFRKALKGEGFEFKEFPYTSIYGKSMFVNGSCTPLKVDGKVIGLMVLMKDVTLEKRFKDRIKWQMQKLDAFIESTPDMTFIKDRKFKYILINKSLAKFIGKKTSAILGKTDFDLLPKDMAIQCRKSDKKALTSRKMIVTEEKSGCCVLETRKFQVPLDGDAGIGAYIKDVTEEKEVEEKLKASEEKFRVAAESISDLIYEWDILTGRLDWFGDIDNALGYAKGEFPRTIKAWARAIHPDDKKRVMTLLERHLKKHVTWSEEYRVKGKKGILRIWLDKGTAFWDEKGNAYKMVGAVSDITEHKKTEEALKKSEKKFRDLAELLPEGVYETDTKARFTYVNKRILEMTGYIRKDFEKGLNVSQMLIHEDIKRAVKNVNITLKGREIGNVEYTLKRKEGFKFPVIVHSKPIMENGKCVGLRGIVIDITELKKIEKNIREKAEDLERFNRLAVGREIKMVELKKRVKELEAKLETKR